MTRRSNFTLVEIIAVLLLIAILAAVAAPKFIGMADEAKKGAAQAGINEAKASLTLSYHKEYLLAKGQPALADVVAGVFGAGTSAVFGDITVTQAAGTDHDLDLTAYLTDEGDVDATNATGSWDMPLN